MKILHILNTGKYSGAENVAIMLINSLKDKCEFAYTSPVGPIAEILEENGIKYYPMNSEKVSPQELKKVIKEYRPDIIHAHDFYAGIMSAFVVKGIPIINHLHNNSPWLKKKCIKSIVYRVSCKKYAAILTVSKSVSDEYIYSKGIESKFINIGNPFSAEQIREKAEELETIETSDIIFVGRLTEQKDPITFLQIIRSIADKKPEIKVAIVGTGELEQQVDELIETLALDKNVKRYGFKKNPYCLMKQSRLLCMTSKWEGFGLVAVEAMALGLPVIAFPVGGLQNIVTDTCGKLCNNLTEYEAAIVEMLDSEKVYAAKKQGALLRAAELDNLEDYKAKILNIYRSILKEE